MVRSLPGIVLAGSNGSLSVSPDSRGWSQVVLHQGDESLPLGAELLEQIAERLTSFLARPDSGTRWVLSLSELHSSIYGEHTEDTVLLKVQNADAEVVATLEVTREQQLEWTRVLRQYTT